MPATHAPWAEFGGLIRASRSRALGFGACAAARPEGMVLILHRRRLPAALGRAARRAGGGGRAACGTLTTSGRVVTLSCAARVPGLERRLRQYLARRGLRLSLGGAAAAAA
jgi:hypothetical protein